MNPPTTSEHPAVRAYRERLWAAGGELPPWRREELDRDIAAHIEDAVVASGRDDDAGVREVLDRLGPPEDVVAAESSGAVAHPAPPSPWGPLEVVAVLGLTVGSFLLPVVGPLAGLVCAWLSERWSRREKVVATVLCAVPILLILAIIILPAVRYAG